MGHMPRSQVGAGVREGTRSRGRGGACTFPWSSLRELLKGFKQKRDSWMATVWWVGSEGTSERQGPQGPN